MKRFLKGILFLLCTGGVTAGIYYIVMQSQASLTDKLLFSGILVLISFFAAIAVSAAAKHGNSERTVKVLDESDLFGITVSDDKGLIFRNKLGEEYVNDNENLSEMKERVRIGKKTYSVTFTVKLENPDYSEEEPNVENPDYSEEEPNVENEADEE